MKNIGFIGVGLMGQGMAHNLIVKGFNVTVMGNRNRKPVDELVAEGAHEATSVQELTAPFANAATIGTHIATSLQQCVKEGHGDQMLAAMVRAHKERRAALAK